MSWPLELLRAQLGRAWPGLDVQVLPEIDSTNTELMRRAREGHTQPVLLVAERQTAGRGRLGRAWASEAAGQSLAFSLGVPLAPRDWSGLSLAVGLALADALHPDVRLKWPNDLWWQGRKLGGILIETAGSGSAGNPRYAVVGVGLNLRTPAGDEFSTPPAGLCELLPDLDAPATLARVAAPLAEALRAFEYTGFAPLAKAFAARDALAGQQLRLSDGLQGQAAGVAADGALLLRTADGRVHPIASAHLSVRPVAAPAPVTPDSPAAKAFERE